MNGKMGLTMKVLLVTFSDNADHQDTVFGLYEELQKHADAYLLAIKSPKVALTKSKKTWLVDCPERPGICKKTFNLPLLLGLIGRIKKEKFDVIYFESLHVWNLPIMMMAGRAKTYQVIHEVVPHEGDSQVSLVELMNKAVCRLSDAIVLRNQMYREQLIEKYLISEERVKCLELWRRYPEFTQPVHSGKAMFFGRVNPYKGADNLLKIAKSCPHIHFEMIGRVDPQMVEVANELRKLPNVHLNDEYVSDDAMKKSFIQADWIILPYNSASQSGVIIDAYKYSRPVIAFNVGAISEQIEDGHSGYLIEAGDIDGFVVKLNSVMKMPVEQYEQMCKDAYRYGSQKYAVEGAISRFLRVVTPEESKR